MGNRARIMQAAELMLWTCLEYRGEKNTLCLK